MGVAYKKSRSCNWIACIILIAIIAAAIVVAVVLIKNKKSSSNNDDTTSNYNGNYTQAMQIALTFLDIQKCKFLARVLRSLQCEIRDSSTSVSRVR